MIAIDPSIFNLVEGSLVALTLGISFRMILRWLGIIEVDEDECSGQS